MCYYELNIIFKCYLYIHMKLFIMHNDEKEFMNTSTYYDKS